jgi:dephospho-CoA kinase
VLIVGLTGGFGTGKSTVAGIFRSLGASVIDSDRIAHGVIKKGTPAYRRIVRRFGPTVLGAGRGIDRRRLADAVFGDRKALRDLNAIVHPEVIRRIRKGTARASKSGVVVIDAPLLIEARLDRIADRIVVVTCPRAEQVSRCIRKFGLDKKEVLKRIESQMPIDRKIKMADHVVHNGGPKAATRRAVEKIWRQISWR